MDYKEKYEESLERLKGLIEATREEKCPILEEDLIDIFPELKELDDEKIEKELIFYFGDMPEDTELRNGVTNRDALVWLEKQNKKPTWSEKDEKFFKLSIANFMNLKYRFGNGYVDDCMDWLKSIKGRFQKCK